MLQQDLDGLEALLEDCRNLSLDYLRNLDKLPASREDAPLSFPALPAEGLGTRGAQELFRSSFYPRIVASSGPRYWGFVTGGTTPAAIAGDWLTTVFDQNTQSPSGSGDTSAALELQTVRMLLHLFGLPDVFHGGFVTGAMQSNFTGLAAARQWWGMQHGKDIAREGVGGTIPVYAATPHSSSVKCLSLLGMGSSRIEVIPTLPDRECLDEAAFEKMLAGKEGEPFILISSAGTVNTVDFDNFAFIASLRTKYRFWWHIDAAFGGFAACSPEYRHLLNGWEEADSITVDCHKWLNTPYDSAVIFTRKEHATLQVQTFQNANAPYLGDPVASFNYLNFLPENSRRFRALPAWFTLMAYGSEGYRSLVENSIRLARLLGQKLEDSAGFELAAPVRLNTVCFQLRNDPEGWKGRKLLGALQKDGRLFITPSIYRGTFCLRAAFVNWRTSEEDIRIALDALEQALASVEPITVPAQPSSYQTPKQSL